MSNGSQAISHTITTLTILCWNIGNPSRMRAARQIEWLLSRPESVFVLTETKRSDGCELIESYLALYGFHCLSSRPLDDYGVFIASRLPIVPGELGIRFSYLPSRITSAILQVGNKSIEIAGIYVPSRDSSPGKVERKRRFLKQAASVLRDHFPPVMRIFCGDFNILEPSHLPRYPFFQPWEYEFYNELLAQGFIDAFRYLSAETKEYSWVGRTGDGYRYDHCFVSPDLQARIVDCRYLHEPRSVRLSDHSAITLSLQL